MLVMRVESEAVSTIDVLIVAIPETAGSVLYGMLDVLSATGSIWQTLLRAGDEQQHFRVRIVSPDGRLFTCGNRIPVNPDCAVSDEPTAPIVILPELWLGPDQTLTGRYPALIDWIRRCHARGSTIYSACSGAILLAETGLLDGCPATSHWAYQDLFGIAFPKCDSTQPQTWSTQSLKDGSSPPVGLLPGMTWRCTSSPVMSAPERRDALPRSTC